MGEELWAVVEGYDNRYLISNKGRVKSNALNDEYRIRKTTLGKNGYYYIDLHNPLSGVRKKEYIHRLIGKHFIKGYKQGLTIDHIDADKTNNDVDNLEWVSQKENVRRAREKGLLIKVDEAVRESHRDGRMDAVYESTRKRHMNGEFDEIRKKANKAASKAHKEGRFNHVYEATRLAHKEGKFDRHHEAQKKKTKLTCVKTGKETIFNSSTEASEYLGLSRQSSVSVAAGKPNRTAGGHYVEYI